MQAYRADTDARHALLGEGCQNMPHTGPVQGQGLAVTCSMTGQCCHWSCERGAPGRSALKLAIADIVFPGLGCSGDPSLRKIRVVVQVEGSIPADRAPAPQQAYFGGPDALSISHIRI